jgi:type I restriction-modification system DNA methylase subunit
MDAAEYKHVVLSLIVLKAASFTPPAVWFAKPWRQARRYFGPEHADTFRRDVLLDLRADVVIANPPFNDSNWFRKDDLRWQNGVPPPAFPSPTSPSSAISSLRG